MDWPRFHYTGTVVRVVDGDTVIVNLDLGLRVFTHVSLRIASIDTPEINTGTPEERSQGIAARDYLRNLLWQPGDRIVYVRTHKDKQTFNRYVADILIPNYGEGLIDVATKMVTSGHAQWSEG
ncbi:MAG: thermonuclease family protein [Chloroflexota bacterium]|nr:thermonuclease family protein [Chloroflexota bacterium]